MSQTNVLAALAFCLCLVGCPAAADTAPTVVRFHCAAEAQAWATLAAGYAAGNALCGSANMADAMLLEWRARGGCP